VKHDRDFANCKLSNSGVNTKTTSERNLVYEPTSGATHADFTGGVNSPRSNSVCEVPEYRANTEIDHY
jgi:hypothetical protein